MGIGPQQASRCTSSAQLRFGLGLPEAVYPLAQARLRDLRRILGTHAELLSPLFWIQAIPSTIKTSLERYILAFCPPSPPHANTDIIFCHLKYLFPTMGSVPDIVNGTAPSLAPKLDDVATALYRHDCANAAGHGNKCPPRWSKFASHEDEQASLQREIRRDPIIHRHYFNRDDKTCEQPPLLCIPAPASS